jgi:hypothetical protein
MKFRPLMEEIDAYLKAKTVLCRENLLAEIPRSARVTG